VSLPAASLKNADEQTVAGLAAVLQAINRSGHAAASFTEWAVLAAPRFLGRATMAQSVHRYRLEGAWGISPHLIPHHSLHSVSGTVSQALKIHGSNFGVGGGVDAAAEALVASAALISGDRLPGVWVVLTGYDPEFIPADPGNSTEEKTGSPSLCGAVALALVAARPQWQGLRLTICPDTGRPYSRRTAELPGFRLESLLAALLHDEGGSMGPWQMGCGGWVELDGERDSGFEIRD
jgi:hypothetical protein